MYLTGFADEAADEIDDQIKATLELGWSNIEARNIDKRNIHDLTDAEFGVVYGKLADAGVSVNCFGSAISNWAKQITDPNDSSMDEVARAIPRMQRLGAKLIRIMSYAVIEDRNPDDQLAEERFKRLREILARFTDAGITPVHENCMNYGGMGWPYTLKLLENVPGLKLVFDTGNPVFLADRTKDEPYPKQSSWDFYSRVKEHIAYIHIKDCTWDPDANDAKYTYPGEGSGDVKRIVKDLLDGGYDGGISIEPHLAVVFHDDSVGSSDEARYTSYVEYGKRLEELIKEIGHADKLSDQ
ncbi:MAG: sugar phosphate isomerase/epimerase [Phycisphaerae bacterium]|jgi:sugar phosphate isomerase/epimerase|nr:sugar phosphate isomerase/epimerase [Phycisphaerae bacterium]